MPLESDQNDFLSTKEHSVHTVLRDVLSVQCPRIQMSFGPAIRAAPIDWCLINRCAKIVKMSGNFLKAHVMRKYANYDPCIYNMIMKLGIYQRILLNLVVYSQGRRGMVIGWQVLRKILVLFYIYRRASYKQSTAPPVRM